MQLIHRLLSPASAGRFAHAMCRKAETCADTDTSNWRDVQLPLSVIKALSAP